MELYEVGGAVRDALLGRAVSDRDWVAVGATPQQLIDAGYVPVGRDFPVFLHPLTREEVALARTERKTAPGYHGFAIHAAPDVTLEQDLARRDLTINAMARGADGRLIDPHGGQCDLQARLLRHVSPAFAEDPVRILRVARFAARLPDFEVAPQTLALMRTMVTGGEVDALVPERVWQELSRALMEERPSRLLDVLRACGALARLLPEVERLWSVPQCAGDPAQVERPSFGDHLSKVLDISARLHAPLTVRYACIGPDLGKAAAPAEPPPHAGGCDSREGDAARSVALLRALGERLRVPTDCRELAEVVARELGNLQRSGELGAGELVRLLDRCDAWRKPARFGEVLLACECEVRSRLGQESGPYAIAPRLRAALAAGQSVDTAGVAARAAELGARGPDMGAAIRRARITAVAQALDLPGDD